MNRTMAGAIRDFNGMRIAADTYVSSAYFLIFIFLELKFAKRSSRQPSAIFESGIGSPWRENMAAHR